MSDPNRDMWVLHHQDQSCAQTIYTGPSTAGPMKPMLRIWRSLLRIIQVLSAQSVRRNTTALQGVLNFITNQYSYCIFWHNFT